MANSSIEWTELTWNPTTGCSKISQGCKFCYAEIMTRRLKAMGQEKYSKGFKVVVEHPSTLSTPYTWKGNKIVFVNSMSDLFHEDVSIEFIKRVFKVMNENPQHTFQVLTKRSERLKDVSKLLDWTPNIWMGVSVENSSTKFRIKDLQQCDAVVKFLSVEPLIGSIGYLPLRNIDWVIVGGESGFKPRPMKEQWVQSILKQCTDKEVAFFFKQWGGKNKKAAGRTLNNRTYDDMPEIIYSPNN
jgi:protein gp37